MKKKIILFTICLLFPAIVFGTLQFSGKNSDAGTTDNDIWSLHGTIQVYDNESDEYQIHQKRGEIQGSIHSTLFGDFNIFGRMNLYDMGEIPDLCGTNQHTYKILGTIVSQYFGSMIVDDSSLYCPSQTVGENIKLTFYSQSLGHKLVGGNITPTDGEQTKTENIFEKQEVLILGPSILSGNISGLTTENKNTHINNMENTQVRKSLIFSQIKKNLEKLTRNRKANKSNYTLDISSTPHFSTSKEQVYYYDYNGQTGDFETYGNKGKILKITKGNFDENDPGRYGMQINENKAIIVKGGNIYINADIYNTSDSNYTLILIATRDKNNNGGNIYIDPNVTNIDATIIAEGSILSYDGTQILQRQDNSNAQKLSKQLYIYGTLLSNNTIGTDETPYGSDAYIHSGGQKKILENSIYDLANLRRFQVRFAPTTGTTQSCATQNNVWVPGYYSSDGQLTGTTFYGWAGKSKCFNAKLQKTTELTGTNPGLSQPTNQMRTIGKTNSLIIEYNPNIKLNQNSIIENN